MGIPHNKGGRLASAFSDIHLLRFFKEIPHNWVVAWRGEF
jgi:hypothetical protein